MRCIVPAGRYGWTQEQVKWVLRQAGVLGTVHWEGEKIFNDVLVIDKGSIVRGRNCQEAPMASVHETSHSEATAAHATP